MTKLLFAGMLSLFFVGYAHADDIEDGTHSAKVRTSSGTYRVPVEVENGEVTKVRWPNGGNMRVRGADIDSFGEASGKNSEGESIKIQVDN